MKIGVISDTHGSVEIWKDVFQKFFHDTDLIIHAGDVLYHGPRNPILEDYNPAALVEELNHCSIPIHIAKGNCDSEVDAMVLNMPLQAPYVYLVIEGKRILVTHGHLFNDEEKVALAKQLKVDIFISGNIHVNVLGKINDTIFLNPGSPSMTKRIDKKATIAIIDNDKIAIKDIITQETVLEMPLI